MSFITYILWDLIISELILIHIWPMCCQSTWKLSRQQKWFFFLNIYIFSDWNIIIPIFSQSRDTGLVVNHADCGEWNCPMQKNNFKILFNKNYFVYLERLIIKQMTNSILNHQWVVIELLVKGNQSLNLQLFVLLPSVFWIVLVLGFFLQTAWHTEINNQNCVDSRCQRQACFTTTKFQNTALWRQTDMCNSIEKTQSNLFDKKKPTLCYCAWSY